jgi:hypothetical protein
MSFSDFGFILFGLLVLALGLYFMLKATRIVVWIFGGSKRYFRQFGELSDPVGQLALSIWMFRLVGFFFAAGSIYFLFIIFRYVVF